MWTFIAGTAASSLDGNHCCLIVKSPCKECSYSPGSLIPTSPGSKLLNDPGSDEREFCLFSFVGATSLTLIGSQSDPQRCPNCCHNFPENSHLSLILSIFQCISTTDVLLLLTAGVSATFLSHLHTCTLLKGRNIPYPSEDGDGEMHNVYLW